MSHYTTGRRRGTSAALGPLGGEPPYVAPICCVQKNLGPPPHFWIPDPPIQTLACSRHEGGRDVLAASGRGQDTVTPPHFPGLTIPLATVRAS